MSGAVDHLQYREKIARNMRITKFFLVPITIVLLGVIGLLANQFLIDIEENTKKNILGELNTVVNSTHDAINFRLYDLLDLSKRYQKEPQLIELVKQQLDKEQSETATLRENSAQQKLQTYFEKHDIFKPLDFYIISPNQINIASSHYAKVGTLNLIAQQKPELVVRIFNGESLVVPPLISDIPLQDSEGHLIDNAPTMFVATPLFDNGKIIAALAFRINTVHDFSQIIDNNRYQPYSDTYVIDSHGHLLNNTRHHSLLHASTRVGRATPIKLTLPQSTEMIRQAITSMNGQNMNGYQNLIGIEVFGSWIWDERLEMGFATETETNKAMSTYYIAQKWVVSLYIFTVSVVFAALGFLLISSHRAFNILQTFNQELENQIAQKTEDLSEANRSLHNAKETAERANNAKSSFLSNMSHELRTPLNAVLGFTQILKTDEKVFKDHQEVLDEIENAGKILLKLINEILDLSSIEQGKLNLNTETIDVINTLERSIAMVKPLADKKHIDIEQMLPESVLIKGDDLRLHQVFVNLLSNAIKYNPEYGQIQIKAATSNKTLTLDFIDNGFGIAEKELNKIFEPFTRLHADHHEIEGTGIGLAITKQLIEQQGGSITAKSTEGKGSTFTLTFPLEQKLEKSVIKDNVVSIGEFKKEPLKTATKKTILLIENNPINTKLFTHLFRPLNHISLIHKNNAEEGLEYFNNYPVDLVLMDINLPGMDGYQALKEIQNSCGSGIVPVIAITARAMKNDIEQGLEAGFIDYLCKPIDVDSLMAVVYRNLQQGNN